jgi:pimeloyl-ACP methyl ester carboxylesterase
MSFASAVPHKPLQRVLAVALLAFAATILAACATTGRPHLQPVPVFVHGWASDSRVWEGVRDQLEEPGVAITLPGHGSPPAPGLISLDSFADAIEAARVAAGTECIVLVAHSNGAYAVREYLRAYPGRTSSVVIAEGTFRPPFEEASTFEMQIARVGANWSQIQQAPLGLDHARTTTVEMVRRMLGDADADTATQSLRALLALDPLDETEVQEPVTFLLAESPMWTEEALAAVRRIAPRSSFEIFTNVSHWLPLDVPQVVADVVRREVGSSRCSS